MKHKMTHQDVVTSTPCCSISYNNFTHYHSHYHHTRHCHRTLGHRPRLHHLPRLQVFDKSGGVLRSPSRSVLVTSTTRSKLIKKKLCLLNKSELFVLIRVSWWRFRQNSVEQFHGSKYLLLRSLVVWKTASRFEGFIIPIKVKVGQPATTPGFPDGGLRWTLQTIRPGPGGFLLPGGSRSPSSRHPRHPRQHRGNHRAQVKFSLSLSWNKGVGKFYVFLNYSQNFHIFLTFYTIWKIWEIFWTI